MTYSTRIWILGTAMIVMASIASAAVRFEDLPVEPTYESACKNWTPLVGQCTVLSAKDSRAKFISTMGGGVHTVYVSQALGDCPLLPGSRDLLAHYDDGIEILIGTGATPDFRMAPRPDVRQRLVDGCLPMMTTAWEDAANKLKYDEVSFVRLIGDKMDVRTGKENSAAFVRVRVTNESDKAQQADLWLSVCGSSNGQDRSEVPYEYRGILHAGKDRLTTDAGDVRVMWRGPEGAEAETKLQPDRPKVEAWGDYADKPVKGHEPEKAFDGLFASWWAPTTDKFTGTAGIGLRFEKPRWLNGITLGSMSGAVPAYDGLDIQYFDGTSWISVKPVINNHTYDELSSKPELSNNLGGVLYCNFEPVLAHAVRAMISKTAGDRPYPVISWMEINYSLDYDPQTKSGKWINTNAGDPMLNCVHFKFDVPANGHKDLVVTVPFLPANSTEAAWLQKAQFERECQAVTDYWRGILNKGAQVKVPERVVDEVWNVNISHILSNADIDPTNGLPIIKTNIGWYDAVWGNLAAAEIVGLDMHGYHADAARYLDTFLKWQGKSTPPGNFKSKEGFLSTADDYTWVRWTSNHGWLLWALSEHYLLSGDRHWLDRVLPNLIAACDWVQRERARTKTTAADGTKPPEWGLLPPGVTGERRAAVLQLPD